MEQWYQRVISGEDAGLLPALCRGGLAVASWFFGAAVALRGYAYDRRWRPTLHLGVPVISVGNLTTGGTGKTPTVIMIARQLQELGRRPAVLTRGYRAPAGGLPDEVMVIQEECPGVPVVINPDRVAGGREALTRYQADVLLLDDGYQHRRLARDMNIVLVDATAPMGIPGLLPRGTWREPPTALRRADYLMLTRCEQIPQELAEVAANLLAQWISPRHIYQQYTQVVGLFDAAGNQVKPAGQRVIALAGIANPDGFVNTLQAMGLCVSAGFWFDDHHHYDPPADFAAIRRGVAGRPIAAWVTTHKDWVKLRGAPAPAPLWHVRTQCRLEGVQAQLWRQALAAVVSRANRA